MATHQLGVYGDRYYDSEPLYMTTEQGLFVWDRVRSRWLSWDELAQKAADEGHTWVNREVGIPSLKWQLANSRKNGQLWAPGLDSTDGLASDGKPSSWRNRNIHLRKPLDVARRKRSSGTKQRIRKGKTTRVVPEYA